ncbi:MAG: fatty acid desaturase [Chitinophagales bacterium]|nr:fatty acid desaturase [Chitinophagales bacterium]
MLRYSADGRTILFVTAYFALTLFAWFYAPQQWYVIVPLIAALSVLSFLCAVIVHNTIHCPIFRKKSWNKTFQVILSLTYGHPVSAYVPGHNFSHHRYTQTEKDNIRTHKARFRWNLLNQLFFMFLMSGDILASERRFVARARKEKPAWFRQYIFEAIIVFGGKIALLIINWKLALLYIVIPHVYAGWGIVSTNYWQHDGCDETHPYNHSRNFTGAWLNWLTFNNGYHGAHHEKPGLHWSLLPKYHQEHILPHLHPNLDQKSLFVYLWKTCIYPAKRVDYLGNPVVLMPKTKDADWVADVKMGVTDTQMGVEA